MDAYTSHKIRILSLFGAFCVVLIHCVYSLDLSSAGNRFCLMLFEDGLRSFAVPFFFVVSGYFYVNHFENSVAWWAKSIRKRIFSLVCPYVIWNCIYMLYCEGGGWKANFGITTVTPLDAPLWYVKLLFLLCCISPLIIFMVRYLLCHRKLAGWVFFLMVALLGLKLPGWKSHWRAFVYFSFGVFLAFGGRFRIGFKPLLVGYVFLVVLRFLLGYEAGASLWLYIPVFLVPLIWCGYDFAFRKDGRFSRVLNSEVVSEIIGYTFFIYCCHSLIVKMVLAHLPFRISLFPEAIGLGLVVFMVALVLGIALKKICRPLYNIITGG